MIFKSVVIDGLAIRDAVSHEGSSTTINTNHRQVVFLVRNGLNQPVTIQVVGQMPLSSLNFNIGSSFSVAASGQDARVLTVESSGLYYQLSATAQCAIAPANGSLYIYAYIDYEDD